MKATITYDLPEELPDMLVHLRGSSYLLVLWELDNRLRAAYKYENKEWADEVREWIRDEMGSRGVSLEDGE